MSVVCQTLTRLWKGSLAETGGCARRTARHQGAFPVAQGEHDQHGHPLTTRLGEPHHRQLLHEVLREVELLDLVGMDVLSVGVDDDVLLAADKGEPTLAVHLAEVTRVEPAIPDDGAGELPVDLGLLRTRAVVAEHDVRPPGQHLAHPAAVRLVDANLDAGQGAARRRPRPRPPGGDRRTGAASVRPYPS